MVSVYRSRYHCVRATTGSKLVHPFLNEWTFCLFVCGIVAPKLRCHRLTGRYIDKSFRLIAPLFLKDLVKDRQMWHQATEVHPRSILCRNSGISDSSSYLLLGIDFTLKIIWRIDKHADNMINRWIKKKNTLHRLFKIMNMITVWTAYLRIWHHLMAAFSLEMCEVAKQWAISKSTSKYFIFLASLSGVLTNKY